MRLASSYPDISNRLIYVFEALCTEALVRGWTYVHAKVHGAFFACKRRVWYRFNMTGMHNCYVCDLWVKGLSPFHEVGRLLSGEYTQVVYDFKVKVHQLYAVGK